MEWKFNIEDLQEVEENYARIERKKKKLDNARPLSNEVLEILKEELSMEWTYNSNSIEGNSLTLQETRIVLQDGMTINGKSLREHFETVNHANAIEYLESKVGQDYVLNDKDILSIHEIILSNTRCALLID